MVKYPRVLVITHNAFDLHRNNGKTLNLLFNGWKHNSIAQLYFLDELPQSEYCKKYFRITDKDVVRSIFSFGDTRCGQEVMNVETPIKKISSENSKSLISWIKDVKSTFPLFKIFRDLIWTSRVWKTDVLKAWLKEFDPEIVFWGVGDSKFSADIAYWISRYLNIPLCMYYGDDYVLNSNYGGFFSRLQHRWIKAFHDRNLRHASKLIAIGDLMASEYQRVYKKEVVVVRTSIDPPLVAPVRRTLPTENIVISYLGGLHLNRWKSIVELGELLKEVERLIERKIIFNIYSLAEVDQEIKQKLNVHPLKVCGGIYGQQIQETLAGSDILAHVESFDNKNRKLTSLSISTKIPEYLASGRCILGYGPHEIASIKLLNENQLALCLTDEDNRATKISKLRDILSNQDTRDSMASRARTYAEEKFNQQLNNETLRISLLNC